MFDSVTHRFQAPATLLVKFLFQKTTSMVHDKMMLRGMKKKNQKRNKHQQQQK